MNYKDLTKDELIKELNDLKKQNRELQLCLNERDSDATKLLQSISVEFLREGNIELLYKKIINAAMLIMHSDFASMQMICPYRRGDSRLKLLASHGFNQNAIKFWNWVDAGKDGSACSEAIRKGERIIVSNVDNCEFMQGTEDYLCCKQTGIRAVQSTPLYSRNGRIIGIISTHWSEPHQPLECELRHLDVLARQAADLIEHKRGEETLRENEKKYRTLSETLKKALITKDEFLSTITHELKTPLTVINAALQTIESLYGNQISDNIRKHLDRIKTNSYRQLRLVNNLLDITNYNASYLKVKKRNLDIVLLTSSIVNSVEMYARHKGVKLIFTTDISSKEIAVDQEKYERVLLNLLSNAIKFTPTGKTIYTHIANSDRNVIVTVRDEGVGIPKNKFKLIFECFGQVDTSLSRQAEGTGIGLSLVKMLVEGMDGTISVNSEVGMGSTFTLSLPATKVRNLNRNIKRINDQDSRIIQAAAIEFSDIYME